uniref:Galactokinase n=1 Tax=Solanum tuberosum TaxID=4113 RepID=M1CW22_SOLTU
MLLFKRFTPANRGFGSMLWLGSRTKDKDPPLCFKLYEFLTVVTSLKYMISVEAGYSKQLAVLVYFNFN